MTKWGWWLADRSAIHRRDDRRSNPVTASSPLAHRASCDGFACLADDPVEPHHDADWRYRRHPARLARAARVGRRGARAQSGDPLRDILHGAGDRDGADDGFRKGA